MYKDIVQCCYIVIDFITIVLRKLLQYQLCQGETRSSIIEKIKRIHWN